MVEGKREKAVLVVEIESKVMRWWNGGREHWSVGETAREGQGESQRDTIEVNENSLLHSQHQHRHTRFPSVAMNLVGICMHCICAMCVLSTAVPFN